MLYKFKINYIFYEYEPKKVPIDYSIGVKLLETYFTRDPYPLSHDDTKKLFSQMYDQKIFKLLDQVFSLNEELCNSLVKILNDDSTDEDYNNYVKLLEGEKELFKFGSYEGTLLYLEPSKITYDHKEIDISILEKLVKDMNYRYTYFEHFSPNDLRNHILSMTINDNYQIMLLLYKLNEDLYYFLQKIIFRKTWYRKSGKFDHEYEVDDLDYTKFTNMLEETIRFANYACEIKHINLNIKNEEDYKCELVGHLSEKEFVSFISKMILYEYESFVLHLLHIDSSNKLLELFKKFLFSVFENGISGYANFKSSDDYTEFITRMDKYE
jgi:hypothetical protein